MIILNRDHNLHNYVQLHHPNPVDMIQPGKEYEIFRIFLDKVDDDFVNVDLELIEELRELGENSSNAFDLNSLRDELNIIESGIVLNTTVNRMSKRKCAKEA